MYAVEYDIVATMNTYSVIIIGGGPSGMIAAGHIIKQYPNATVLLIEKNKKLGEKLSITGGGRCNITNATFDLKELLPQYGDAEKFLYSAFSQFSTKDTITFFENLGLPLVIQARNRVFPKTEKAPDVTKTMIVFCTHPNITIKTNTTVTKINRLGKNIDSIETEKGEYYSAQSYIFATGGLSHPETGSTGDGFNWLTRLGHKVKTPTPTLVPWKVSDTWIHSHTGTAIDDCKVTVNVDSKKYFSCIGRILCTHIGLSGPTILNHSSKLQDALLSGSVDAYIDLYPQKNHKEIDEMILEVFEKNKNKKLKNVLSEITRLHSSELMLQENLPYDVETPVNSVSKDFRKSLIQLLKKLPIHITGLEGYEKSIVADGGVLLTEVDTKTMRSNKVPNLFITGDLLDIRRPSGGYSLQLCWTTGFVAGTHCLE